MVSDVLNRSDISNYRECHLYRSDTTKLKQRKLVFVCLVCGVHHKYNGEKVEQLNQIRMGPKNITYSLGAENQPSDISVLLISQTLQKLLHLRSFPPGPPFTVYGVHCICA
jgi:hypothetical protein